MNKLVLNTSAAFIEPLIYSKVHDIWASKKEFDYLSQLIRNQRTKIVKQIVKEYDKNPPNSIGDAKDIGKGSQAHQSTGVKGPVRTNESILRDMVAALLKNQPYNNFWKSLHIYRHEYTFKQAAAIKRGYDEMVVKKPGYRREEDALINPITEKEMNDPNWTPWD